MTPTKKNILYLLKESNLIEDETDRNSLVDAHKAWDYIMQHDTLDTRIIKRMHEILMFRRDTIPAAQKGDWRHQPIYIGDKHLDQPHVLIESLMQDWIEDINDSEDIEHHVRYEKIHPFADGNGRTGRILLWWAQAKSGRPLTVITNKNKFTNYYPWFE